MVHSRGWLLCSQLPAGAPGAGGLPRGVRAVQRHLQPRGRRAGGLRQVPRLLRRAPRLGASGGWAERAGHRGAPALLCWPQVGTARDVARHLFDDLTERIEEASSSVLLVAFMIHCSM